MATLHIVGKAGDYRIMWLASCYPKMIIGKMHGDFLAFCYDEMYLGNFHGDALQEACEILKMRNKDHFWPYEHKKAYEISVVQEILSLNIEKMQEDIEVPVWFPDYLNHC